MSYAIANRDFMGSDHEPLALLDFPTQLKLDFLDLDMSPTHVDLHNDDLHHDSSSSSSTALTDSASTHSVGSLSPPLLPLEPCATRDVTPRANIADADQRAKNRLIVKRCYYKKINTLNDLRSQMERIEAEYNALLAQRHAAAAQPTPATATFTASLPSSTSSSSYKRLHDAYVELLLLKSAMQTEQRELTRLTAAYATFEKQTQTLQRAEHKALAAAMHAHALKRRQTNVSLKLLTPHECHAIAAASFAEIERFRASSKLESTGASVFGWHDRFKNVTNDKLMFSLDKTFLNQSVADLATRTWDMLSTPSLLERAYSPNVDVSFEIIQRISDDAIVYYHTLERGHVDMRIHALVLATRVDLGNNRGVMILFRGLDPQKYALDTSSSQFVMGTNEQKRDRRGRTKLEPQKEKIWMDTFTWGIFEAVGESGEHCRDDYGGVVEGSKLVNTSWWVLETLLIALRVEAHVVGPQIVLTAS